MRIIERATLSIAAVVTLALPAVAQNGQEVAPKQTYAAGVRLKASSTGVSFAVPQGWQATLAGQDATTTQIVLANRADGSAGVILLHASITRAQLLSQMTDEQDLGNGTVLQPVSKPSEQGNRATMQYETEGGAGTAIALRGQPGNAFVALIVGTPARAAANRQAAATLASSVTFSKPAQAAAKPPAGKAPATQAAAATPLAREWTGFLSGMMLRFLASGRDPGSFSGSSTLHLCSDGSFVLSGTSLVSEGGAFVGSNSNSTGIWRIGQANESTAELILTSPGGTVARWQVDYDGNATYVNGERWYRVPSDACR